MNWLDDLGSRFQHHLQRHLHILLIAVKLATFAIVPVPGQTNIAPIGARCIGVESMVPVPLESQGGEAEEGGEYDTVSVAASFGFEESLPGLYPVHSMLKV